jgi:hypothetical protein
MAALRTPPPRAIEGRWRDVRSLERGMGILGWQVYLALLQKDATDGKGDGSVVIITIFLVAVGQFSPLIVPNSWLLQRSGTRK